MNPPPPKLPTARNASTEGNPLGKTRRILVTQSISRYRTAPIQSSPAAQAPAQPQPRLVPKVVVPRVVSPPPAAPLDAAPVEPAPVDAAPVDATALALPPCEKVELAPAPPPVESSKPKKAKPPERQWRVIYHKPPSLLDRLLKKNAGGEAGKGNTETQIDRYEMKILVQPALVPQIRQFIAPFVEKDKNTYGDPPSYTATTMQIDSINSTLHYAKARDAEARFKLRIRTYGFDGKAPYFFELKRKIKGVIYKSRAVVMAKDYSKDLVINPTKMPPLKKASEQMNLLEFIRLNKVIGGIPALYLRYERECYAGIGKEYSRITFDRNLRYRPAMNSWVFPLNEPNWYCMDSETAQNRNFSGNLLELKFTSEMPDWMHECVERFNLVPAGHCKFSMAMNLEALHRGHSFSDTAEDTTPFETAADI